MGFENRSRLEKDKFLKAQRTNQSHNIEIIAKALDHLGSEHGWKREVYSLGGPSLLKECGGNMKKNQQKIQKESGQCSRRETRRLLLWSAGTHIMSV